ncbi:MAG: hypothetical protein ABS46_00505 [Cytophagaceae bacterium SCN 52-12]|nr:MAG: hypothetical protein ABS46_00505 [Cytophagaceae bacterium SCN 52-12]
MWMAVAAPAARAGDGLKNPCRSCESLKELLLPDVRIDSVSVLTRPDICVLTGVIGREITFELLLPAQWNGRFVMGGGGGFVGYVMNRARNMAFDGFATVGTDTGHKGTDAGWGLNDMERQLNFGHAAVHRTAEVARAVIRHYYAAPPRYSYFIGLSRGGGQAMMEAQRYPHDFDGIVAGAPAFNWVGMATKFNLNTRVLYGSPENRQPAITRDHLRILQQRILEHCDAYDGVRDSILSDPLRCDFNLEDLPRCKSDIPGEDCFTGKQIDALKSIYAAVREGDKVIHGGFPFGGEDEKTGWFPSVTGPIEGSKPYPTWQAFYGMETFKYLVFNDGEWRYDRYDWQRVYRDTRYAAAYLNATGTDYSAFRARGGKMILYQGWADPLISALDLVRHYEEAVSADTHPEDHIRLFMLPGVTHTGGNGPGKADWFRLISDWVEKGIAPERVIVSKTEDGKVVMTRPVFPYPRVPVYDGAGDPDRESSFK